MSNYEVLVSNVGKVYDGYSRADAIRTYLYYKGQSEKRYGRASGEDVTIYRDNEVYLEYQNEESFSD